MHLGLRPVVAICECAACLPPRRLFTPDPWSWLSPLAVICGHVDSGKSTTTGRLLFELGGIPERELEKLKEVIAITTDGL